MLYLRRLVSRLSPTSSSPPSLALPLLSTHGQPTTSDELESLSTQHRPPQTAKQLAVALLFPFALISLSLFAFRGLDATVPGGGGLSAFDAEWRYRNGSNVDVLERLWIASRDGRARASFIALGASLVDLYVPDREGQLRDVVLGYDNTTLYPGPSSSSSSSSSSPEELPYPYYGAIVGRYANRIANGTSFPSSFPSFLSCVLLLVLLFVPFLPANSPSPPLVDLPAASYISPSGETIHLPPNERGRTTLHGGLYGYSRAGWRVREHLGERIAFELVDEEGVEGFPGTVLTTTTYTLTSSSASGVRLNTRLESRVLSPDTVTPIMLSSHAYFNLDGYRPAAAGEEGKEEGKEEEEGQRLWVAADRQVEVDGDLIPTGHLHQVAPGSALDFSSPSSASSQGALIAEKLKLPEVDGLGTSELTQADPVRPRDDAGCTGIDNALVLSPTASNAGERYRNDSSTPVLVLSSARSGIRMSLKTNQPAIHLYTCNAFSPSSSAFPSSSSDPTSGAGYRYPRKSSHRPPYPSTYPGARRGKGAGEGEEEEEADAWYPQHSCLAIEPEGLIDGVHWADEWGVEPFYTRERPYIWETSYEFSTFRTDGEGQ
ncbi:hypothetical protein JCM10213_005986 [Rhodosporidiobolus nylandii]